MKTEYPRKQFFFKNENYVPPITVCLGEKLESVKEKGIKMFKNVPVIEQYVPIKLTLKQYLEFGDNFSVLQSYMHYVDTLPPDLLVNFCQGSLWKNIKSRFHNKIVAPLFFYYDDFNVSNSCGPHSKSGKLGAVYYTIGAYPPRYWCHLNNIFLALLFKTENKDYVDYSDMFEPIIEDLIKLESKGIELTINGTK